MVNLWGRTLVRLFFGIAFLLLLFVLSVKDIQDRILPSVSAVFPIESWYDSQLYIQTRFKDLNQHVENQRHSAQSFILIGDSHFQGLQPYFDEQAFFTYAVAGATAKITIERLPKSLVHADVDQVIILLGFNDLKFRQASEVLSDFQVLVRNLQRQFIDSTQPMILMTLMPVAEEREYLNVQILELNAGIKQLAVQEGITVIDLHAHFLNEDWAAFFQKDGVHLNPLGNEWLSDVVDQILK